MGKFLRALLLASLGCVAAYGQTGIVTVESSSLVNSSGVTVTGATISFAPVNGSGLSISYRIDGKGQSVDTPVTAAVTNGAFTLSIADTSLTSPVNVCFAVTVTDNASGDPLLGPGYACVQPAYANSWCTAGVCNFDDYTPSGQPGVVAQTGGGVVQSLTTTGTSGPSTLINGVLNIPQYAGGGGSMTWPSAAGFAYYGGSNAWTTPTSAEAQALIGVGVYDPSGAAASAQSTAESYAADASHLSSGTVAAGLIPVLNQNTTGTAANITAATNDTLTTLPALSLPYSQLSGAVPVWNQDTTGTAANITATTNATLTTLSSLSLPYSQLAGSPPTWNQDTTGTAAKATALGATPSQCSGGQFSTGIAANGDANCSTPSGSGGSGAFALVYDQPTSATGAGIAATTMVAAGASATMYTVDFVIEQTGTTAGCTTQPTIEIVVDWTEAGSAVAFSVAPNAAASGPGSYVWQPTSVYGSSAPPWTLNSSGNGAVSLSTARKRIFLAAGSALTYTVVYAAGAACTTQPSYTVYPLVVTP